MPRLARPIIRRMVTNWLTRGSGWIRHRSDVRRGQSLPSTREQRNRWTFSGYQTSGLAIHQLIYLLAQWSHLGGDIYYALYRLYVTRSSLTIILLFPFGNWSMTNARFSNFSSHLCKEEQPSEQCLFWNVTCINSHVVEVVFIVWKTDESLNWISYQLSDWCISSWRFRWMQNWFLFNKQNTWTNQFHSPFSFALCLHKFTSLTIDSKALIMETKNDVSVIHLIFTRYHIAYLKLLW